MGYSGRHWRRGEKERGVGGSVLGEPSRCAVGNSDDCVDPVACHCTFVWGLGGGGGVRGEGKGKQTRGVYGNQHARNYSERKMT